MIEDEADMPPFHAWGMPETVDAGCTVPLVLRLAADRVPDATGLVGAVLDAEGIELAAAPFGAQDHGWHVTAPLLLAVPADPGAQAWRAVLRAEAAGEPDEEAEVFAIHTLAFEVCTHAVQAVVWDVPATVEAGSEVTLRLGLRCSAGCCTAGWGFAVLDDRGVTVARGTADADPWPGTAALHAAAVTLTAPAGEGLHRWTVVPDPAPEGAAPHAARPCDLALRCVPAARHALRIRAVDARTGAPVPRAKVVAHPYRAQADAAGEAVLHVAPGRYTVFVSGRQYFAYRADHGIEADLTLVAELFEDRAFSDADAWA